MKLEPNREVERVTVFSIVSNLILIFVKGGFGWLSGSRALMADAVESVSDLVGSVVTLIGIKAARIPPDKDHPYGHGKAEPIAAIIVSVIIMVFAVEVVIRSVSAMNGTISQPPEWWALIAVCITLAVKETLFRIQYRIAKQNNSKALMAHAWEHRSDVYSQIAVFAGVGGAWLGQWLNIPLLYWLDPLAGVAVGILIFRMGFKLVMEAIHNTMDHVMHPEQARELIKVAQCVPGIIGIDELRAREHGHYVIVDVKISVNPQLSVHDGHEIAKNCKNRLMEHFPFVTDVMVHVNPFGQQYPYKTDRSTGNDFPTIIH